MGRVWLLVVVRDMASLDLLLPRVASVMVTADRDLHVVAVDDGAGQDEPTPLSIGATDVPIDMLRHRFPRGLGESLRDGLEWIADRCSASDVVVTMEPDGPQDPEVIGSLLRALDAGADVAIASRFCPPSRIVPAALVNAAAACMGLPAPLRGVRDYTSGLRAYRAAPLRATVLRCAGHLIEPLTDADLCHAQVLVQLARQEVVCREVPLMPGQVRHAGH